MPTEARSPAGARRALLVGAGGHGKVVADTLQCGGWEDAVFFVDDDRALWGQPLMGLQVLGPLAAVLHASDRVHVAVGSNQTREELSRGIAPAQRLTVIHPSAVVSRHAELGNGCFVAAGAVVGPCARVGAGAIVNHGAVVDHDCIVGDFCHIAPLASLAGQVRLGARVLVGAGARVLPGVKVGDDVVIGAGAVVLRDVASGRTVIGVPAVDRCDHFES